MKFLSTVIATKCVLIFLCVVVLTIDKTDCTTNATMEHDHQQPSSSSSNNRTAVEAELVDLLQSIYPEETVAKKNVTAVHASDSNNNATAKPAPPKRTCACDDSEETLICASNGVTYKNSCRFECAKARVNRLRQVKQGRCSQAGGGTQSYWQSTKSG